MTAVAALRDMPAPTAGTLTLTFGINDMAVGGVAFGGVAVFGYTTEGGQPPLQMRGRQWLYGD